MDTKLGLNLPSILRRRKTAYLLISSLFFNLVTASASFARDATKQNSPFFADPSELLQTNNGAIGQASNTVIKIAQSAGLGYMLGNNEFVKKLPGNQFMVPILGILGASTLGLVTFVTDPGVQGINKNMEQVGSAFSSVYWGGASQFGHYKVPTGLVQVHVKGKKHPDGAIPFDSLTFDHTDEAKLHIESTVKSIQQGDPLKNAIFYGDAGTGKSAVARSFAHLKGFKVYSVSGHKMTLERSKYGHASFKEITNWLKKASNKDNKIIIDISEGDSLLRNIAERDDFQNYFKKNYDSSQENFALFFSCNFNHHVGEALKKISETSELDRRFKDRVNFKTPSAKVRMLLLKNSITDTIINFSSKKMNEDKSIYFDVTNFFDGVFANHQLIKEDFVSSTEGYSHDHMIKLGQKLVQVFVIARVDQLQGIDPRLAEFDYIDDIESKPADPLDQVLAVLRRPYGDSDWVQEKTKQFVEKQMEDIKGQIPLLKLQREYHDLLNAVHAGNYEVDESGRPRKGSYGGGRSPFGGQQGGGMYGAGSAPYGGQSPFDDQYGPGGNDYDFDGQGFPQ